VALCRLLLSKPDMLLLDEPTNHLDAESVEWLEQFLLRFPGTVVGVTHDRYFLDNACQWILELDRGMGIPYQGNYSAWLEQKERRLETESRQEQARIKAMKEELAWVRQNAKGRQAKSKARLQRFEELSSYEYQTRNETNEIFIPVAERLGNEVIEFTDVSKSFGDRLLIDKLSMKIPPGAIVGVIGLGRFNFKGGDQQKIVGQLSGGERGRLHLAKTLLEGGNVLLLDEPSNDLDVETLRALEEALLEFAGTAIIISHDRWFLDRICTHILAAEGDSQWVFYPGNYREYEDDKKKRLGDEGAQPHRIRYKALK